MNLPTGIESTAEGPPNVFSKTLEFQDGPTDGSSVAGGSGNQTGQPSGLDDGGDGGGDEGDGGPVRGPGSFGGTGHPFGGGDEGSLPDGTFRGGYPGVTRTFLTSEAAQKVVNPITPALFSLRALPQLGDSSVGPVLIHAGILANLPGRVAPPALPGF